MNFTVEHTPCSSYVWMIGLPKYCKMVNVWACVEIPWLVREYFLFLGKYFFLQTVFVYFCSDSCLNVTNLDIAECVYEIVGLKELKLISLEPG